MAEQVGIAPPCRSGVDAFRNGVAVALPPTSLQGIKRVVDEGAHYEAQQMYKTVHHRYHTKGMLEDSYKILEEGAVLQLATGHLTCGVELGLMLIEAYEKDEVGLTEEACRRVDHMLDGLPEPPTCSSEGSIDGNCKGTEGSKARRRGVGTAAARPCSTLRLGMAGMEQIGTRLCPLCPGQRLAGICKRFGHLRPNGRTLRGGLVCGPGGAPGIGLGPCGPVG
eukprot:evm.model.scf_2090.2 EVM.evm.TU.scf_2090.2   scf_2090:3159-6400(+)